MSELTGKTFYDSSLDVTFTIGERAGEMPPEQPGEEPMPLYVVTASNGLKPTLTAEAALLQYLEEEE